MYITLIIHTHSHGRRGNPTLKPISYISLFFPYPFKRRNQPPSSLSIYSFLLHFHFILISNLSHIIYIMRSSLLISLLLLVVSLHGFLFLQSEGRTPFACDPKNAMTRGLRFCRMNVAIHLRVQDLIGRLTLQEKIRLLVNNAIAIPRLGIEGYDWWSEALHGVSDVGPGTKFRGAFPAATSFPQVISTAASFNESLWNQIGQVRFILSHFFIFYFAFKYIYIFIRTTFFPFIPFVFFYLFPYFSLPIRD